MIERVAAIAFAFAATFAGCNPPVVVNPKLTTANVFWCVPLTYEDDDAADGSRDAVGCFETAEICGGFRELVKSKGPVVHIRSIGECASGGP